MSRLNQAGVTLVELVIGATISTVVVLLMSTFLINRLNDYNRSETTTILQAITKLAVESVQRDVKAARSVENTNTLPDPSNAGGWTSSATVIVLSVPASDASGNLLYIDTLHNSVYQDNVIFFVDPADDILYKRTIANPAAGNASVTTCAKANVPSVCTKPDVQIVEDVASLSLAYYDSANALINLGAGGQPSTAGAVEMTLQQRRTKAGRTYSSTFTNRASLRNK